MRKLLLATLVVAAVGVIVSPVTAMRIAFRPPAQRAIGSEVVVVGKVTGFEKDLVQAAQIPGSKDTVGYKIAIVKIEKALAGANKMTEIKVGFIPPPKPDPNAKPPVGGPIRPIRPGIQAPELKEGQELILFLARHQTGDFYVMPGMTPPVDVTNEQGKKELEAVTKVLAVLADPMKGLKSNKAEVRAETATILILKYRSFPALGGETEQVAIPADESKLILRSLAGDQWSGLRPNDAVNPPVTTVNPIQAFYALGLTDKDGWIAPVVAPPLPGSPPVDFNAIQRDAFTKWLDGPGKNYQIKKVVPKEKK